MIDGTLNAVLYPTMEYAREKHCNQEYAGLPYTVHLFEVLENVIAVLDDLYLEDVELLHAAILHDVLEDTDATEDELRAKGFSEYTIQLVKLVTKDPTLTYAQNIQRIIDSGLLGAMVLKLCDNFANYCRTCNLEGEHRDFLQNRYSKSMKKLREAIDAKFFRRVTVGE